jgi:hypothetical protein
MNELRHLDLFSGIGGFSLAADGRDSKQSPSSNAIPTVKKSSRNIGHTSQSIPTSATSTDEASGQSLYSQGDFLANHSVSPGSSEARQMTAISGLKCSELFNRQTPIGSLVRTLLASTDWASTIVFLTWKPAATKSRRHLKFQLVRWMQDMSENDCGLWPTPKATIRGDCPSERSRNTPDLPSAVKMYPTPCASDNRDRGGLASGAIQRRMEKGKQIMLSQCVSEVSGQLNPNWVEWLMGYPIGHTGLKDSEMPSSLKSRIKSRKPSTPRSKNPSTPSQPRLNNE